MIIKGFQKLINKGPILMYDDLNEDVKNLLEPSPEYVCMYVCMYV